MPSATPTHAPDDLLGPHNIPQTPQHAGISAELPLEPLENLHNDLPAMENMGYDQVSFSNKPLIIQI